jgi:hypothetical protein
MKGGFRTFAALCVKVCFRGRAINDEFFGTDKNM